jgi:hypothetical protein
MGCITAVAYGLTTAVVEAEHIGATRGGLKRRANSKHGQLAAVLYGQQVGGCANQMHVNACINTIV